ncbi:MAG TPA: c-type cytochrome [Acidisarcina sp.]|nr:c-type cytochrome [Acidisarcina sp.]
MNRTLATGLFLFPLIAIGCSHKRPSTTLLHPTAYGSALIESSGGKQEGAVGTTLSQPLVVQVNDEQDAGVAGALVEFQGPYGASFDPSIVLTDSSGQATTNVTMGGIAARYPIKAITKSKAQKEIALDITEIALGYQEEMGYQLGERYCARCHNPESSAERVSNYDNLEVKPHTFSDGATLNKMSDAELTSIIDHGGVALNKSALMPPYGYTLNNAETQALVAYIRLISEPPYQAPGMAYAQK